MMIALAGHAGAGKSTAIQMLEHLGVGRSVYVGAFVTREVERRGLPDTPASEKEVRQALRNDGGMAALANLALPDIQAIIGDGHIALLDAIYCNEEREFYEKFVASSLVCIGVDASEELRRERLSSRKGRPFTAEELSKRDTYERKELRLDVVLDSATCRVSNNGSLDDFKGALASIISELSLRP